MAKSKFTTEEQKEIARIMQSEHVTRKTAIRKLFPKKAAAAPAKDVKSAAANDKPEVEFANPVDAPITVPNPKAKKTRKSKSEPKPTTEVVVSKKGLAARADGLRLYMAAGRPTKSDFIKLCGKKGPAMTWAQRAEHLGVATPEAAAEKFAALKGGR